PVVHNTVVANGFGEPLASGGAGITIATYAAETVRNNVVVSNQAGINVLDAAGTHDHNLVWGNGTNYAGAATSAVGDLPLDPLFANPGYDDFRLKPGSPAIDAGVEGLAADDFDGIARPKGAAPDLGAHELDAAPAATRVVISEVMANPVDEKRGEFVEVFNAGDAPVDLAGAVISDGDALDVLVAFGGGTTVVAPGAYAVIADPDYLGGYGVPEGVTVVATVNSMIGNGLATTDALTLYASGGVTPLATYLHPFDPGNGVSAERVDLEGSDVPTNWRASPCMQSAGRPNCAPVTLAGGLVVSEVMANPLDEGTGEFVELYNGLDDPVDVAGMKLADGQQADPIVGWQGGSTVVPPRSYAVVLDPDWPAEQLFRIDPNALLLTVGDGAIGSGLGASEAVTLLSAAGEAVSSYSRTLMASNGRSVEKVSLSLGDIVGNWAQSSCDDGSSPGRLNCVSAATAGPRKPLVLTEVMANPADEDVGEFVEIHNRGVDPVDVAGLLVTDGDATDVIQGWGGGPAVIPSGGYGVVLDAEYAAGLYDIPASAVLLTTADTTIGSGLAIDDALRLIEANGVEIIDTFRFPFNPGNGISAERIDVRAFDSPANWTASTCASGSSPGADNCAASPAGLPKRLRLTEIMANQAGNESGGAGEFVELFNAGDLTVDLAGMHLEIGPVGGTVARDLLGAWSGGSTVLVPGAYAVVLDPQYDGRYSFPAGTVLVTIPDASFGAGGIATTHGVAVYDADGITLLDRFAFPSDPGDGVSLFRVNLNAVDSAGNWSATPCDATPGTASCPDGGDVATYASFWVDRDGSEAGHFWHQAIGWPEWARDDCELLIVCTGALGTYDYRDNFPAPAAFIFENPYPKHSVVFVERSGPTDRCSVDGNPCPNPAVSVGPGKTAVVPASGLGWYYAQTTGPSLNTLDWFGGDADKYWALPPDGTLPPFTVEVTAAP
ncbi:MAG: lamin tail domain-containing protein, partial [Deltaproteobacteria bacterium]|nr:lamin tail domain-containing protein [Deltaproteobacteria bacterium]